MKQSFHNFADTLSFLPILALSVVAENGPSWKTIAGAVIGGAFTVTIGVGGYWLASQDRAITDLRNSYIEAKVTMAGLQAATINLKDSTQALKEQLDYERRRREQREDQERTDLKAAGKK